jgi:hypothetical protein
VLRRAQHVGPGGGRHERPQLAVLESVGQAFEQVLFVSRMMPQDRIDRRPSIERELLVRDYARQDGRD